MRAAFLIPVLFSAMLAAAAQESTPPPAVPPSLAPNDLVRKVVDNEIRFENEDKSHWMYQVVSRVPAPAKTKTVVETTNGDVNCLDEIGGHPLTPQQRSNEEKRIERFVNDPEQQRKARRASNDDDEQTTRLFAMLPDAFLFHNDGADGDNIKLLFQPNPKFRSHSTEAFVFHKMDGFVIVNTKENRLVEISGRLTHGVEFMGGMLGHLDSGGTFDVRRDEVAPGHWEITKLKVNMNGKILFFKTIDVQQDEVHSHFQRIADSTTLEQAELLAKKKTSAAPAGQ